MRMMQLREYRRRPGVTVNAIGFGDERSVNEYELLIRGGKCPAGTWLVQDAVGIYTVSSERFVEWFEEFEPGRYVLPEKVVAWEAPSPGNLSDGTAYSVGDWILKLTADSRDEIAMTAKRFDTLFECSEGNQIGYRKAIRRYCAFISYSRKDARIANRIHRRLERYRLPRELAANRPRNLGRFFKDDDELGGNEGLGTALNGAIDDSDTLIVIASPDSARSEWVQREVLRFKRRRGAKILAVIARGSPDSQDSREQCFVPALRYHVNGLGFMTTELADSPLAPDLTSESFTRVFVRLVAALVDRPFDDLWKRERRRNRQRRVALAGGLTCLVLLTLLALALTIGLTDAATLRSRAARIATEQWRFHSDAKQFEPSFRAALAASILTRETGADRWDLSVPTESTSFALALSGRVAPYRRIFGDYPETSNRGNYRDDIADADPARRLAIYRSPYVRSLGWSGDGKRVAMLTTRGQLIVYDVNAQRRVLQLKGFESSRLVALDSNGDKALVVAPTYFHLINVTTRTAEAFEMESVLQVHEIAYRGSQWLVVVSTPDGTTVASFEPGISDLRSVGRLPDFTPYFSNALGTGHLLFCGYDSESGLWPLVVDREFPDKVRFTGLGRGVGEVKSIATNGSGRYVALGGNGSGSSFGSPIQVIGLCDAAEVTRLVGHTGEVYALDFLGDSDILASGGSDFTIRLWDAKSGRELIRLAGHLADIYVMQASPNGALLATAGADGMVFLWNLSWLSNALVDGLHAPPIPKDSSWATPSTIVTVEERDAARAYLGRPWDLREWRQSTSPRGLSQSLRSILVREFGWIWLDYPPPNQ